jgi:hypothetical protein
VSRLVDSEAVLVEFEAFLVRDGRQSHGTDFLTRKLAELRAQHRIDESTERQVLRHLSADLTDTFLGLVPNPATNDPLTDGDLRASAVMDDGAAIPSHPPREATCQTQPQELVPALSSERARSRPGLVSHRVPPPLAATTSRVTAHSS